MVSFFSRTVDIEIFRSTSFVFLVIVFLGFGFFAFADERLSGKSVFQDTDQDGLTNEEETLYGTNPQEMDTDGDSYGDGAEIRGGYDPLKPAPNDKVFISTNSQDSSNQKESSSLASTPTINNVSSNNNRAGGADSENLTTQVSEQITEILKQSSTGNTNASSLQSIQDNIQQLLEGQNFNEITLPIIDKETINIKKQDYKDISEKDREEKIKQDTLEYITKVSYIIASNAPEMISSPEDMQKIASGLLASVTSSLEMGNQKYLTDLAEKGNGVLKELNDVAVPENMLDSHIKAIQLFQYASTLPTEMKSYDKDPLANMVVLSKIQGLLGYITSFVKQVDSNMKEIGIDEIPVDL